MSADDIPVLYQNVSFSRERVQAIVRQPWYELTLIDLFSSHHPISILCARHLDPYISPLGPMMISCVHSDTTTGSLPCALEVRSLNISYLGTQHKNASAGIPGVVSSFLHWKSTLFFMAPLEPLIKSHEHTQKDMIQRLVWREKWCHGKVCGFPMRTNVRLV